MNERDTVKRIISSFIGDPPDNDFQKGFLAAALMIGNEVMCIPNDDPVWAQANSLLKGEPEHPIRQRTKLSIIDGDKQ